LRVPLYGDLARIFAVCERATKQNAPRQVPRGVNCRWLRGLEHTYSEQSGISEGIAGAPEDCSRPLIGGRTLVCQPSDLDRLWQ